MLILIGAVILWQTRLQIPPDLSFNSTWHNPQYHQQCGILRQHNFYFITNFLVHISYCRGYITIKTEYVVKCVLLCQEKTSNVLLSHLLTNIFLKLITKTSQYLMFITF